MIDYSRVCYLNTHDLAHFAPQQIVLAILSSSLYSQSRFYKNSHTEPFKLKVIHSCIGIFLKVKLSIAPFVIWPAFLLTLDSVKYRFCWLETSKQVWKLLNIPLSCMLTSYTLTIIEQSFLISQVWLPKCFFSFFSSFFSFFFSSSFSFFFFVSCFVFFFFS